MTAPPYIPGALDRIDPMRSVVNFQRLESGGLICYCREHGNGAISLWMMMLDGWEIMETMIGPPQYGSASEHGAAG